MASLLRALGGALVIISLALIISYAAPAITVTKPGNATISDNTPDLNITVSESSNVTYSWNGARNISGCKNCTSFNTTYGEISDYTNTAAVWHFNEDFGPVVYDDSPNGNSGSINGNTQWVGGKFGKALEFDGSSDYVAVPHSNSLIVTNKLTIFAWIKPKKGGTTFDTIVEKFDNDYMLFFYNRNVVFYINTTSGFSDVQGNTQLNNGTWYCVAGTYDGSTIRIYVNGQIDSEPNSIVGNIINSGDTLRIGGNGGDGEFNGTIDEVAIFNKTLSASEISQLCNKSLVDGNHNVTVYAKNASGNINITTDYFTVDTQNPYRIDLNYPSNGSVVKENVTFNWTSYDATSSMSSNLSINGTVRNASIFTNNGTPTTAIVSGLAEGSHYWSVVSYDAASNANTSATFNFTVDATPPNYTTYNMTPLTPKDNESVTCYSFWNDNIGVDSVIVEENATGQNHTVAINAASGWGNYTIPASDLEAGNVQCRFHSNDTAGNLNATAPLIFSVGDTSAPLINDIVYLPSSIDDLDPDVRINISANVTDFIGVNTVLLQFKQANESAWINTIMNNTAGNKYEGNFTPSAVNNWSFRIVANDTSNLINTSSVTNLSIDYDRTWSRTPASFGAVSGVIGTNITIANITINNTGDFDLNFSLTADQNWVSFNVSNASNVNVSSHNSVLIRANATVPVTEGSFPVLLNISSLNSNATPNHATINGTLIAFTSGPFLYVTLDAYDPSVAQGDTGITLTATVKNMGNESAATVWLAWVLPSGWENSSGRINTTRTLLSKGSSFSNTITASVSSSAQTGAQTLSALSGSAEGKNGSASASVTVSAAQAATQVSGGGGGPSAATHRVTPSYSPSQTEKEKVFPTPKTLELVKGQNLTFTVNVSNPFLNSTLQNISLRITGYKPEYIWITPASYSEIEYGSTKEFTVNIYAPPSENTIYPLTLELNGRLLYLDYPTALYEGSGAVASRENVTAAFLETKNVNLIVYGESPPSYSPAPAAKEALLPSIGSLEVVRGSKSTASVIVKNPFKGSVLKELALKVEGYPSEYLSITPRQVDGLGYQETAVFSFVFEAPSYFEKETKTLKVTLRGIVNYPDYPAVLSEVDGRVLLTKDYRLEMAEEKEASLTIHEVSREATLEVLERASRAVEEMRSAGLGVKGVVRRLESAKDHLARGDYEEANQMATKILDIRDSALNAKNQLMKVGGEIKNAEDERWLKLAESITIYDLARAAYEREDYDTAIERLKEAQATLSLETKGKVNVIKVLLDNLIVIVLGSIVFSYSSFKLFKRGKIARISARLKDLHAEEAGIVHLIKETQTKYYKDKTIGGETYVETMRGFENRLAELSGERVKLLAKKPLAIGEDELVSLKNEDAGLVELLLEAQKSYFEERSISKRDYDIISERLKTERSVVQEKIAVFEASREKGRRGG